MNKRDIKSQFRLLSDYCKMGYGGTVGAMLVYFILSGLRPYINLILMGMLIDRVYTAAPLSELLSLTALALGFVCLSSCVEGVAQKKFFGRLEYNSEQFQFLNIRKCLQMDYPYLESQRVHETLHSIRSAGRGFSLLGRILDIWGKLISAFISVVTAFVVVIPLFINGGSLEGNFLTSRTASLLLFLIIGVLIYSNYKADVHFGDKIKQFREKRAKDENKLSYYMGILAGYEKQKDLRIYRQQDMIKKSTTQAMERIDGEVKKEAASSCISEFLKQTLLSISLLSIYLFAGYRAHLGLISVGSVVTYAASIVQMSSSLALMMRMLAYIKTNARYTNDYVELMELGKEKKSGTAQIERRADNAFLVEFDHVSFKYPGTGEYVIKDLSLQFTIGERMAIVGKNGSGKTTFIKLLCRLYDVTQGCIRVNGRDIREYDYAEYCNLFSVVFQDFQMFAFALGENIAGGETVDADKAVDALNRAGMGEAFKKLPRGLDTFVGKEFDESGVTFSGGEKQKMAIARAIYKDAPFVIMDEPTAALDPLSECEVYEGFDKMVGNKTAIYISHRLASCRFCSDILVFDRGRVVQRGSHEKLEQTPGLYKELWEAQAQYYR